MERERVGEEPDADSDFESEFEEGAKPSRLLKKLRGVAWMEWEDRALAKQVLADNPIVNRVGRKEDRWGLVSEDLRNLIGIVLGHRARTEQTGSF